MLTGDVLFVSGIETATIDLQKENEDRLWQEGILRHVPVVGSFVNWWSPKTKEGGVRGRSLNLTQGVVESTENIYRYKYNNCINSSNVVFYIRNFRCYMAT